ncbi:putative membrane protein [hydrocarbon metagenome]|uniref:Putative membrane protein n=1 Tax=hydrocarbon metagenome TaxID=938273 RepID=A0A0W8G590_9ZZZZ
MTIRRFLDNPLLAVARNVALITLGALIFSIGVKAVAVEHGFISGGVSGLGLLLYYLVGGLGIGSWYFALNVPLMFVGWFSLSRRFILYTLYGMAVLSVFMDLVTFRAGIDDPMLAAIFSGAIMGAGVGIALRSSGSLGGTDIVAIALNQKWNLRVGKFNFYYNLILFSVGIFFYDTDLVLYSVILSFVSSTVMEYFLSLFNQRKMVLIISDHADQIAHDIVNVLRRGSTFLYGRGAYTGKRKKVILTITNTVQIKRLEELVFSRDKNAFFVVENTFNVLGEGFSRRKVY